MKSILGPNDGGSKPRRLPWADWQPGQRVVVRYVDDDGSKRDALGTLVENAVDYLVIDARRGRVRVDARSLIVGRLVTSPRPQPRTDHQDD